MKKITEQIILYDTAKLANEKGFDIPCQHVYFINKSRGDIGNLYHDIIIKDTYRAPTQALLQKWLRDKHNIQIAITFYHTLTSNNYFIRIENDSTTIKQGTFDTYEEALEEALRQALTLI